MSFLVKVENFIREALDNESSPQAYFKALYPIKVPSTS